MGGEVVHPGAKGGPQGFHVLHAAQLGGVGSKAGLVDVQQPVRPPGGPDGDGKGGVRGQLPVPFQGVQGIVGGGKAYHVGTAQDLPDGQAGAQRFIARLPDVRGRVLVQGRMAVKVALQLQVGPMVHRVAGNLGQAAGKGQELLIVLPIPGDEPLRLAAGPHEPPFVMVAVKVAPQPKLGEVLVNPVLVDLLGGHMAMIVDDGHWGGIVMIQRAGRIRVQ